MKGRTLMAEITIKPTKLKGEVTAPPSKSVAHRALICAALSGGSCKVSNIELSDDIIATIGALKALGADILVNGSTAEIKGFRLNNDCDINCLESGSTLRFLIPIAAALSVKTSFTGEGKLKERPIGEYIKILSEKGVTFTDNKGKLPLSFSGKMSGGKFFVSGDVSSQYISGLLLAFPLINENCEIILSSNLESAPYIDITIDVMNSFGVYVERTNTGFLVKKGQKYLASDFSIEGDYSQAAFWLCAAALDSELTIKGLNPNSVQGDKAIINILKSFGAEILLYDDTLTVKAKSLTAVEIDASQTPDLVPVLASLACFAKGQTIIRNAGRLVYKESNRLFAVEQSLKSIGADITMTKDGFIIYGKETLKGGRASGFNDHRIVMSLAVAATRCENDVIIEGYESVSKSYPRFFEEYKRLGGITI